MNTLDALVQEDRRSMEAAAGKVWPSPESTDYMKIAFLEAVLYSPEFKKRDPTISHTNGIDNGKKSW